MSEEDLQNAQKIANHLLKRNQIMREALEKIQREIERVPTRATLTDHGNVLGIIRSLTLAALHPTHEVSHA